MDFASLSSNLLLVSFIAYLVATLFFGGAVKGAKSEKAYKNSKWGTIGIIITIIGFSYTSRLFHNTMDCFRTCTG